MRGKFLLAGVAAMVAVSGCGGGDGGGDDPITGPTGGAAAFLGCNSVQTVAIGSTTNGALASTDCRLPDQSFVDFYELQIAAGRSVTIAMNSAAFDAYLIVFNRATGTEVAEDDDGGGGTNARVVVTLQAGTYVIAANAFDVGSTGAYQLSVN